MTALAAPRVAPVPAKKQEGDRKVILHGISWKAYTTIGDALQDRNIFLTYDQGTLEIMTLSSEHERYKGKFGRLVPMLARHFRKNFESFGSFTQKREDLLKGIEADDCF